MGEIRRKLTPDPDHFRRVTSNIVPPNPGSDAFHAALGLVPVGTAERAGKMVTCLGKRF